MREKLRIRDPVSYEGAEGCRLFTHGRVTCSRPLATTSLIQRSSSPIVVEAP